MRKILLKILPPLFVCLFSVSGCTTLSKTKASPAELLISGSVKKTSSHYYIDGVPFTKQKGNLCGPAALSSIFNYYQKNISQEKIAQDIYLIPVHGVLNIDLENYAKERGFWTYVSYEKDLSKIKEHIRRDKPVLALMSSPSYIPFKKDYHYLVLLGYEEDEKVFIAHSGRKANEIISYRNFLKNWAAAEYWSLIACPKEAVDWDLDAQGYNNLGFLLEREGKLDLAIEKYKASLNQSERADTLFNLGNAYLKKKKYEDAISYYKQSIALDPKFADCYNNLAYTYMVKNLKFDEAIRYAKRALELKPSNKVYYLDTLGMVQFKKGMFVEAIESFEEASELAADKKINSLIQYHLGLVKLKIGLISEARENLKRSIELNPQSEAKDALKNLL